MESSILTAAVSFFIHIYCLTHTKIEELRTNHTDSLDMYIKRGPCSSFLYFMQKPSDILSSNRAGVYKFSKNLEVTSKFQAPEELKETIFVRRFNKYQALSYKIYSPRRTVVTDFCTAALSHSSFYPPFLFIFPPYSTVYNLWG